MTEVEFLDSGRGGDGEDAHREDVLDVGRPHWAPSRPSVLLGVLVALLGVFAWSVTRPPHPLAGSPLREPAALSADVAEMLGTPQCQSATTCRSEWLYGPGLAKAGTGLAGYTVRSAGVVRDPHGSAIFETMLATGPAGMQLHLLLQRTPATHGSSTFEQLSILPMVQGGSGWNLTLLSVLRSGWSVTMADAEGASQQTIALLRHVALPS